MPKTKKTENFRNYPGKKPLSSEELSKLKNQSYWGDTHRLKVASPDPMLYPRSLWRKVEEIQSQNQNDDNNTIL